LQTEFAKDVEVVAFFRKLHGGLPVKLQVLPAIRERDPRKRTPEESEALADRAVAPPAVGFPVVLRVSFDPSESEAFSDGKQTKTLTGAGLGGVRAIWFDKAPVKKPAPDPATPQVALLLAANDFLLHKGHGWLLFESTGDDVFPHKLFERAKTDRVQYKAHLDEVSASWTKAFRAYWSDRGIELK
jgi:hypothetical protein